MLRKLDHGNIHLQRAWNISGENSFLFEILECILHINPKYIRSREGAQLLKYRNPYNIQSIGEIRLTRKGKYKEGGLKVSKKLKGRTPKNLKLIRKMQKRAVNFFIDEIFQRTFESQRDASRVLNISKSKINTQVRGLTKTIREFPNYRFEYSDGKGVRKIKFNPKSIGNNKSKKIKTTNSLGEIKIFNSIKECAIFYKIDPISVTSRVKNLKISFRKVPNIKFEYAQ